MPRPHASLAALLLVAAGSGARTQPPAAQAPITPLQSPARRPFSVTPVQTFDSPWAMAFLPDGRLLVTEKKGTMKLVAADMRHMIAVGGVPRVDSAGQGALMDVKPAPSFARDATIYFSFSEAGPGGKGVALARARLVSTASGARLDGVRVIFRGRPKVSGDGHYSGRILFAPDGRTLFFTNGERQKFTPAQDPKVTLGKVLRLNPDGTPAPGNPLAARGFDPAIWSYGHRNLLGLAWGAGGRLWEIEMGPMGGDELNLILPGRNYGWPIVSNGDNYDGTPIPDHPTRPDFEAPKASWNPVISPSSLVIYSGRLFHDWAGNALIGGLSSQSLERVAIDGDRATPVARYDMDARIRAVAEGPDGAVWLLEDGPGGRLLRLTPSRR